MNMIGIKREVFRFSVEGKMTDAMVGELGEAIRPAIVAADNIEIDLSQVSEVDFAGLRLMADAKLDALGMGKRLCFAGHSKPVAELAESYGMSGFLDAGSE
ncbi:STAS domain protein [mine drainage metagenome]|uniref:STAS domain protein n=1 Tax=mine drainage metagenome TaxID=410659 RepID=A0A1J5U695_9ZZZZ